MSEAVQTAYSKAISVAQALMATAQEHMSDIERMEHETASVKKAFRTAFDFWTEMQPFVPSEEFFQVAASKMKEHFNESGQDALTTDLLMAVYAYYDRRARSEKLDA